MPDHIPETTLQQDEWRRDLNPQPMAGRNRGNDGPHPELTAASAYDLKDLHRRLQDFEDDELKQIPVLPPGSRLEQGATYIDLHDPEPKEFNATAAMVAGPNNWYVPKSSVDYQLWNRLIGVRNPERLGRADDT